MCPARRDICSVPHMFENNSQLPPSAPGFGLYVWGLEGSPTEWQLQNIAEGRPDGAGPKKTRRRHKRRASEQPWGLLLFYRSSSSVVFVVVTMIFVLLFMVFVTMFFVMMVVV